MIGYSEHAFQQAWSSASMRLTSLRSDMGQTIDIIDAGSWNHLGGPDFLDAKVLIDGKLFRGGIELHLRPTDWYSHGHHLDSAYNCVVLHASPMPAKRAIVRADGTRIPHIGLERLMPSWLPAESIRGQSLACSNVIQSNFDVLITQLEAASSNYFEELVERHLLLLRSSNDPTIETLRAIFIRSCSVLGAPANRETMTEAATLLWDAPTRQLPTMAWRLNSGRPASRPGNRMKQARALQATLQAFPASRLHITTPSELMRQLFGSVAETNTGKVIFTTVLLPALWVHATLQGDLTTATRIRKLWDDSAMPPSPDASKAFGGLVNQVATKYRKALTWQHRNLCTSRNCGSCQVGIRMMN
jgi:hypothetical protein